MPDHERLQLPLRPSGPTLASHIAALDLLSARLDALPSRSRWPARVPINSKASFDGDIVHTNEVKVHMGDYWVEMTATEAADYVRKRKATLLEEHARLTEGQTVEPSPSTGEPTVKAGQRLLRTSDIKFDPLLAQPIQPIPAGQGAEDAECKGKGKAKQAEVQVDSVGVEKGKMVLRDDEGKVVELPGGLQNLVDLVGEHLHDKLSIPNGGGDDSTVNEAGEPIYEIREDTDGRSLGPVPEGSGEGSEELGPGDDDYFSPEAVERRAALRRRIFHEGDSDDEDDDEEDMDVDADAGPSAQAEKSKETEAMDVDDDALTPKAGAPTAASLLPPPEVKSTPTTPTQASYSTSSHSPSAQRSPVAAPKGILKAPVRKKSVTFDSSIPLPPDSPPGRPKRQGFPLDQMVSTPIAGLPGPGMVGEKEVPILKAPLPGRKKVPETFGGLRTGFLSGASGVGPILSLAPQVERGRIVDLEEEKEKKIQAEKKEREEREKKARMNTERHPAKMVVEERPTPAVAVQEEAKETVDDKMDEDPVPASAPEKPKKKSLFAQRRTPNFPKQSDTAPMITMKGSVVEAPSATSSLPSSTTPSATHSRGHDLPPTVGSSTSSEAPMVIVDDDSDTDDYGDLGEFSDDEEDEYALDEALLAREVALEYHRRQAWQRPVDEDEIDPEAAEAVMGIPRVSTISGGGDEDPLRIVNPTADDLSQFLRVGRGEDGELVFEQPLVHSESESEGEDDSEEAKDRRQRRERRKDVMRRLMTGNYDELPAPAEPGLRAEQYRESLPPTVGALQHGPVVEEVVPPTQPRTHPIVEEVHPAAPVAEKVPKPAQPTATRDVVERTAAPAEAPAPPQPPKKVSRFKAARMQ